MRKYNVVGVMSGTSMDGLDLAHCTIEETEAGKWSYAINAATTIGYEEKWRLRLSKLRHQNAMVFHKSDRFYGQFIGENIKKFLDDNDLGISNNGIYLYEDSGDKFTSFGGSLGLGGKMTSRGGFVFESTLGFQLWTPPPSNFNEDYVTANPGYVLGDATNIALFYLGPAFPLMFQMKFGYNF